jgi:two-component system KDP operon response regulator KdpE
MPNMGGLELIRLIRFAATIPVLVLSSSGREDYKEAALDLGADDYIVKPIGRKELLGRVAAALTWTTRERSFAGEQPYMDDAIAIDFARREVAVDGRPVALTKIEYLILTTLVRHTGQTLSYNQLLDSVWGPEYDSPQYVTWHVGRLRRKVERDPERPERIVTVRSVGYRYDGHLAAER